MPIWFILFPWNLVTSPDCLRGNCYIEKFWRHHVSLIFAFSFLYFRVFSLIVSLYIFFSMDMLGLLSVSRIYVLLYNHVYRFDVFHFFSYFSQTCQPSSWFGFSDLLNLFLLLLLPLLNCFQCALSFSFSFSANLPFMYFVYLIVFLLDPWNSSLNSFFLFVSYL